MIKTFYELTYPERDGAFGGKDWTTYHETATQNSVGYYYLRNDGSGYLIDLFALANVEVVYFETELECHREALKYYNHHGKAYPYMDRIFELGKMPVSISSVENGSKTVQSEEMFF